MFQIKHRFLGDVLFECELPGNVVTQSEGVKLGFAIKIAVGIGANMARAYLFDANLSGANLAGANLDGASLSGANLVDGGQRSDGYSFVGWIKDSVLQIRAGCRSLSITEARKHWIKTRGGTALGEETMVILDHIERVAKIRGLIVKETTNDA